MWICFTISFLIAEGMTILSPLNVNPQDRAWMSPLLVWPPYLHRSVRELMPSNAMSMALWNTSCAECMPNGILVKR